MSSDGEKCDVSVAKLFIILNFMRYLLFIQMLTVISDLMICYLGIMEWTEVDIYCISDHRLCGDCDIVFSPI